MRIDAHAHIFTLYTILSREGIRVLEERLKRKLLGWGFPAPVAGAIATAIGQILYDHLDKPEYLDERRLLKALLSKLQGTTTFDDLFKRKVSVGGITADLTVDVDELTVNVLRDVLAHVLSTDGGPVDKVLDVLDALRRSMQPTITDVAIDHLKDMDPDGVLVGLMMDIFRAPESEEDHRRYLAQIKGHEEAALQRPGQVLNFFGVHPDRPDVLQHLKRAIEQQGFVGVKLYPSLSPVDSGGGNLGQPVHSEKMKKVYDYCLEQDLPILLHCGHGGFYRTEESIEHCNPKYWEPILNDPKFHKLRVCFAHFGGHEALSERACFGDPDDPSNWGAQILRFIRNNPNVYTDLAKHVAMFEDAELEQTYFDTMGEVINEVGNRVLFGTDAWLLRLDMPYDKYWQKWKQACTARSRWDAITVEGPKAFLGFDPDPNTQWAGNLQTYIAYMRAHRTEVGRVPAAWLSAAIAEPFVVDRDPPGWDRHKRAVRVVYQFLGKYLIEPHKQRGFAQNGDVHLNELTYFDPGDPNFAGDCRDMARRFVDFADQQVGYRAGHDFTSAVDRFIGIFRKGDLRLRDVAVTIDSMVAYPESIS